MPIPELKEMQMLLEMANQTMGRLDGLSSLLPNLPIFLYSYVRKEALLSSQIEGTQSSLSDLLLFENAEAPGVPLEDVQEVSNYVAALTHGMARLREGFPVSLRLIREMHGVLLAKGRGSDKEPGEFRRSQNWIGGTRPGNAVYVPPPPDLVMELMGQLETFWHLERADLPLLVKAGMAHVQFETIHPFLDGNGRLGRLLITMLLHSGGALHEPILYLSLYFKKHRDWYYELLNGVRADGDWEAWLEFFFTAVKETSEEAVRSARRILALHEEDRKKVEGLGRSAASAVRVLEYAQRTPILKIASAAEAVGMSFPAVGTLVEQLVGLGILKEITGRQRGRLYSYERYLAILSEGTEPLS